LGKDYRLSRGWYSARPPSHYGKEGLASLSNTPVEKRAIKLLAAVATILVEC
jgi:hypothetical protein